MLTKDQLQILNSLAAIKLHNGKPKNIKLKFQVARYNKEDIATLEESKLIRLNLLKEFQITLEGETKVKIDIENLFPGGLSVEQQAY